MAVKRKIHEKIQVILLESVRNLGKFGEEVSVRRGYARNFLIPHHKAVSATVANRASFGERRAELERLADENLAQAKQRCEALSNLKVVMKARAADEGKLYGSVGIREIAIAITQAGVAVQKSELSLPRGPIRILGEHTIAVQLHTDVIGTVNLLLEEEK